MKHSNVKHKHNRRGWATMELLITFPVVIAALLMVVYFGLIMKSKIALQNATHAAAVALAKTGECGQAQSYLDANFDRDGVIMTTCSAGSDRSIIEAQYAFIGTNIMMFSIPATIIDSRAVAYSEFE